MYKKSIINVKELLESHGLKVVSNGNSDVAFLPIDLYDLLKEKGLNTDKGIVYFEFRNRMNNTDNFCSINIVIGPEPNVSVRNKIYQNIKASELVSLFNIAREELAPKYKTIYNEKLVDKDELHNFSTEEVTCIIVERFNTFVRDRLDKQSTVIESALLMAFDLEEYEKIENNPQLKETEKTTLIKSRIGHSELKRNLLSREKCCKLCALSDSRFLIASHIKPWSESNNQERLDVNNALLLCPQHDSVFDKGYISFDEKGNMLISSELSIETRQLLNLVKDTKLKFTPKEQDYLAWHRQNMFKH